MPKRSSKKKPKTKKKQLADINLLGTEIVEVATGPAEEELANYNPSREEPSRCGPWSPWRIVKGGKAGPKN